MSRGFLYFKRKNWQKILNKQQLKKQEMCDLDICIAASQNTLGNGYKQRNRARQKQHNKYS